MDYEGPSWQLLCSKTVTAQLARGILLLFPKSDTVHHANLLLSSAFLSETSEKIALKRGFVTIF